jgi:hypothetical protein
MKLHRNAALGWRGRRQLAQRVIGEGWTVSAAAEAGRRQRALRTQVGKPLPPGRRTGSSRSLFRTTASGEPHAWRPNRSDRRSAAAADDGCRDLGDARDAARDRRGAVDPDGDARIGRIGLEPAQRYERGRPSELVHLDVKKLGRIEGGAG